MATHPARANQALPDLTWRGLPPAPCSLAPFDFGHTQAERRYPYLDSAGHDHTGRNPNRYTARLFFLNTVLPDSFPGLWNRWRVALFDGSSDWLVHPVLGMVRARVLEGRVELKAEVTSGVVVDVTWTDTIDDPNEALDFNPAEVSLEALAAQAGEDAAAVGIYYPDGTSSGTSLAGAVGQVTGEIFSAVTSVKGLGNQVVGNVEKMIGDVERLNDALALPAYDNLCALWGRLTDALQAGAAATARAIGVKKLASATTLDAFALATGNRLTDIMGLNLHALGSPIVRAGTELPYYSGK